MTAFETIPESAPNPDSARVLLAQSNTPTTSIAIIGMACRLPGGIDSPDLLWEALLRGDDLITEIPPDRWDADEYYDPSRGCQGGRYRVGAHLSRMSAASTANSSGSTSGRRPRSIRSIVCCWRPSWEAMEHAGVTPASIANSSTGVFVGLTHGDYQLLAADAHSVEGPYGFTGTTFSLASGRIAYALGVHGPAMTVDSACSSGLLAVHMACRNLHDGESNLALAGGASVILDPRKFSSGSAQGMLSPTGRCHAFDTTADGFVPSEGCAVVLLKRLADAQRDGDRILAVIRGSSANQDGRRHGQHRHAVGHGPNRGLPHGVGRRRVQMPAPWAWSRRMGPARRWVIPSNTPASQTSTGPMARARWRR